MNMDYWIIGLLDWGIAHSPFTIHCRLLTFGCSHASPVLNRAYRVPGACFPYSRPVFFSG